jgi:hypothetical protein
MPDRLPTDLLDRGLGIGAVGALTVAWAESSRYQLDGLLKKSRARALRGWTQARETDLMRAGAVLVADDAFVLVGYLDVNRSRREIEQLRRDRQEAGSLGGVAGAGAVGRDSAGHFESRNRATYAREPDHLLGANSDTASENNKVPVKDGPTPTSSPSDPRGWYPATESWDSGWMPFLRAWRARGFSRPPTEGQRRTLWDVIDSRPEDAAIWAQAAPAGSSASRVVGHVLMEWKLYRSRLDLQTKDERFD